MVSARTSWHLPYMWARMRIRRDGDVVTYESRRRWPGPPATSRVTIEPGTRAADDDTTRFLTDRTLGHRTPTGSGRTIAAYTPRLSSQNEVVGAEVVGAGG